MHILLPTLLILPLTLSAAEPPAGRISVQGTATVRVAPELAIITLGIETNADLLDQAHQRNEQIAKAVVERLGRLSPLPQIQLGVMSLGPVRDYKHGESVIVSQAAHQAITVTSQPGQVQALVLTALQAGATHILGVEYAVRDVRAFRDQARLLACKAAREKADLMAVALGAKLGAVVTINEPETPWSGRWSNPYWSWGGYWSGGGNHQRNSQNVAHQTASGPEEGAGGETQSLSATIAVSFALL
jgi:uncharacterized protein YggE